MLFQWMFMEQCKYQLFRSDDTWEEISPGKSRNTMKMEHLSRAELNTELECQVANSTLGIPAWTQELAQLLANTWAN